MFGREPGDDHVTRAWDAIDRGHGVDGRERAGQESGRPEREPEREKAAEPKPKTPDVDLGV